MFIVYILHVDWCKFLVSILCLYIVLLVWLYTLFVVAAPFHQVKFLYIQMYLAIQGDSDLLQFTGQDSYFERSRDPESLYLVCITQLERRMADAGNKESATIGGDEFTNTELENNKNNTVVTQSFLGFVCVCKLSLCERTIVLCPRQRTGWMHTEIEHPCSTIQM